MYSSQTYSGFNRYLSRQWAKLKAEDEAYKTLYSPYFKTHYNGKLTKRYIKAQKDIRAAEGIKEEDLLIGY